MFPEIFSFGPFHIRSYGLMLAMGFLAGIMLATRRAARRGENPDHIYSISVRAVIWSLLGSRFFYVITHYDEFRAPEGISAFMRVFVELRNMFWPVGSDGQVGLQGLTYYGGLIAATIATVVYLYRQRLSLAKYLDILAPSIPLGEMFTRIGCFLNGCCFGHPTHSVFGVVFPESCAAGSYYPGLAIHPTQLYNSFAALVLMAVLLFMERYKKFEGYSAAMFFFLYAIIRFLTDFFRYYDEGTKVLGLSENQFLSIFIFLVSGAVLAAGTIRARRGLREIGSEG